MNHILNYFCKLSQDRLKERIKLINNERKILKEKPRYRNLKNKITCTELYKNKPKIIKNILNEDYTQLKNLLTYTIAESIKENMKLKPELITKSSDNNESMQLKINNREFLSVFEIFWGNREDIINSDSEIYYNLILNFCLDFLGDNRTRYIMNKNLINYIPYARYVSYEDTIKRSNDNSLMSLLIGDSFRNDNIDVLGEAIYNFSKSNKAREVANLFVECINSKVAYDSKDSYGEYDKKNKDVHFKNFQIAFEQNLDKFLEIISMDENNLGERVYNIIKEDCKLIYEITHAEMSGVMEDRYLTVTEKPFYDVYRKLSASNSNYINDLIDFQKKLEGDIENEYFDKNPFGNYKSQYYCEERFLKLCSQKVAELESEIEEKQFRELEELQKLEQLQSGI
ncbi:hypothetical protein O3822_01850 [Gemella sanguinis]|uniref:hypothetical protein n=1 Tax=Gemella sanguinis TaxID=84135 RepID=UPI00352DEBF4